MRDTSRPSTPRRNVRPGGVPPPSARKGMSAGAANSGCLLFVILALIVIGVLVH